MKIKIILIGVLLNGCVYSSGGNLGSLNREQSVILGVDCQGHKECYTDEQACIAKGGTPIYSDWPPPANYLECQ